MPKTFDNKTFAYNAAVEAASRNAVGFFIQSIEEDEGVVTYLFEGKLKGYVGWRWSVSVFQGDENAEPTVSEVLLVPGPDSLVAPDWVPWSERLADYKALQAELEAQAALEAEEAEDAEDGDDSDETIDDSESDETDSDEAESDTDEIAEDESAESEVDETVEDSALANVEEGVEPEADAGKTRKRPRFLRRRNRGAGKKKND
jgi:hypothetical protein